MRSIREIFARAVILQCFDDRIVLEMNWGEFTRPIKEREDERILMRDDSCIIRTAFLKHPDKILVTRGQHSCNIRTGFLNHSDKTGIL